MSVVDFAKKEILATTDIEEELKAPLSWEYFLLLKKKIGTGVVFRRLAFGTKEEFVCG